MYVQDVSTGTNLQDYRNFFTQLLLWKKIHEKEAWTLWKVFGVALLYSDISVSNITYHIFKLWSVIQKERLG